MPHNNIYLYGADRSGLSLASAILNSSHEIELSIYNTLKIGYQNFIYPKKYLHNTFKIGYQYFISKKISIIDDLNSLYERNHPDGRWIWAIRDPIVSVCSYINNLSMNVADAMVYWYESNLICWYFYHSYDQQNQMIIKFEDLILLPAETIQRACAFIGIHFSPQYLNYGDFDQPYLEGKLSLGHIDIEHIDPYDKSHMIEFWDLWSQYQNTEMIVEMNYNSSFKD